MLRRLLMNAEISFEEIKNLVGVKLDQGIDDPHMILEVVITDGDEFYNAYAVIAIQKVEDSKEEAYHNWTIQVHKLRVALWGDILQDHVINENGTCID